MVGTALQYIGYIFNPQATKQICMQISAKKTETVAFKDTHFLPDNSHRANYTRLLRQCSL